MFNFAKTAVLMAAITALFIVVGGMLGGEQGMLMALLMAVGMNFFSYWFSDTMVLKMTNAQQVDERSAPQFYGLVKELSEKAGLPMPKVFLINEDAPNAFATGRNPDHASVAATTGILKILSNRELRGVMAHELAHVRHRDILISTVAATMAGAISALANFAMFFGGRDSEGRPNNPIASLMVAILAPIAASLIQMSISRAREYEADRGGAEISSDPEALAHALEKIHNYAQGIPFQAVEQHPETAQMMILNPLSAGGLAQLFSTHPPTEERVARLMSMAKNGTYPEQINLTDQNTPRSLPLAEAITIAAQAISEVMSGRSLTEVLDQLEAYERPIVQSLSFDALRKWVRSHELIKQFIPKTPPPEVDHLLSVAIALFLQGAAESKVYPAHTIVDQAVKACGEYDKTMYAKGLVNAVLRKVSLLLNPPEGEKRYPPDPIPMYVPAWWRANLKRNYSKIWQAILFQQAKRAPLILRVNQRQHTREQYQSLLSGAGISSKPINELVGIQLPSALLLPEAVPVSDLPGFYSGAASVQDAGAQLAAVLLNPQEGELVLDACAAPGGKTAHLLELADCSMQALELDAGRMGKIGGNLDRLRLHSEKVRVLHGDASKAAWWDGILFDKILLDAPCSASGIVSRHPDIPFLRREADIKALQEKQRGILNQAWKMLKAGGTLLYVTCSIFPEEGEGQAVWFAEQHPNALRLDAPGQILPGEFNDGFYYALFKKNGP